MPIALVSSDDEKAWHRERARRVTKTDATRLAGAGIGTFKRIHAEKAEGSGFGGNAATRRGHRLEPVVQSWVEANLGIPPCGILFAHESTPMHAATPDCALQDEGEWSIVEIKTTTENWSRGLPRKIIRDVLWQRYVMGAGYAAVVWWRVDKKGQPLTLEPTIVEVAPDPEALQQMIDGANAYLQWVEDGRPEHDAESGLPLDVVQAIADYNRGKEAEKTIRTYCENQGSLKVSLPVGGISFSVVESDEFDRAAFEAAAPNVAEQIALANDLLKAAQAEYRKPKIRTSLTISAPKEAA